MPEIRSGEINPEKTKIKMNVKEISEQWLAEKN